MKRSDRPNVVNARTTSCNYPAAKNQVDKSGRKVKFSAMFSEKNFLPLILIGLLFVSAIISAVCATLYVQSSVELRGLQMQAATMEQKRALTRALAQDAIEYSKRNPAIDPILQSVGLKAPPASPKATK
jgi:hypothetical protein